MTERVVPAEVAAAAEARSAARRAKDWPEADRLRAAIESAGWKVVDRGLEFTLEPAHPPTIEHAGRVSFGASADVPSRLDDAPAGLASVVLVATDWPEDLERALAGIREHAPDGTQVVVVADAPSGAQAAALERLESLEPRSPGIGTEVVWTSARLGHAAALNAGIRRAAADVVIVLETSVEPIGDFVTPLAAALGDPTVAVAGAWGMTSIDLRRFEETEGGDAEAVAGALQAFRRADYAARGPLDEAFRVDQYLDVWWCLVLRDEGEDHQARRAIALRGMPLVRHERRPSAALAGDEPARLARRNFYRVIDRFGARRDLAAPNRARHDRPDAP